jgi:glutamate 5-kinase
MVTKLQAADLARRSGTAVIIARGSDPNIILKATSGEVDGTRLTPIVSKMESRKRYLLSGMRSSRILQIDEGAANALLHGGSLLPVGIQRLEGTFERGDTVRVLDPTGKAVAVGLVNYSSRDLEHLCGHQSGEIESLIGFTFGDEVIHRNNLMLL